MVAELDDLTDYLSRNGYVPCGDCKLVLLESELKQHREREHKEYRRTSNSDQESEEDESIDANNNAKKDMSPKTGASNPFNARPINANVVNESFDDPDNRPRKISFYSNFDRENISPNVLATSTSRLAIKFPVKNEKIAKHVSFDENITSNLDEVDEATNLIDFYGNDDNSKSVTDSPESPVLSESVSSNGSNPFKVNIEQPFDLENFKWNSEAGQNVVKAKNIHSNDNDDDDVESMIVTLSTSCEMDDINRTINVDRPETKPRIIDSKRLYFVLCRECNNNVVASTWHTHMKRIHKQDVDPDCVPNCVNDNLQAVYCDKCDNIMPRSALEEHMARKHGADEMIGVIMRSGPDDHFFNRMVADGKIYAKHGTIFCKPKQDHGE